MKTCWQIIWLAGIIAERWAALIKEHMDSGMTIKEGCRERNIEESQYYYWLKTLREEEADGPGQELQASPFVELPAACPGVKAPGGKGCGCYPERGYFHRNYRIRHSGFY